MACTIMSRTSTTTTKMTVLVVSLVAALARSPCSSAFTASPGRSRSWGSVSSRPASSSSRLRLTTLNTDGMSQLLGKTDYDTIRAGHIAVVPDFIPPQEVLALRTDAQGLHAAAHFSTDALASYGTSGKFDASKDRAVLRLGQWKDTSLGTWDTRRRFGNRMAALRADLAHHLDRPKLETGAAVTEFGQGSTEISYTRFGPGAFLRRHVDEHHEELKGRAGWSQPTRRSLSWLIYLNDADWNGARDGGQLRCFQRRVSAVTSRTVLGARPNGDLQIAWLRASATDPVERPVYLDGRRPDHSVAMYVLLDGNDGGEGRPVYITKDFEANPILYMAGGEMVVQKLLMADRQDLAQRFHLIEPPKSKLGDLWSASSATDYAGQGTNPADDEVVADIDPIGGTLVVFDSVALPHEVLATKSRERWATSGWFHEDQQPPKLPGQSLLAV